MTAASPAFPGPARRDPTAAHPSPAAGILLDACAAWRTDVVRVERGLRGEKVRAQSAVWLQIAQHLEQLRSIPAPRRAEYARGGRSMWQAIARATGEDRYARLADVMATSVDGVPELDGVRELLWAIEQAEAEGALHTAYNMYHSLTAILPDGDLRTGYVRAQSGRVLRTLGLLPQAQCAYQFAAHCAAHAHDQWLLARAYLGLGAIQHSIGTYETARDAFSKALAYSAPYQDVRVGAHLGLVSVAAVANEYGDALQHAWTAYHLALGDVDREVEALALLTSLSLDVHEFEAAQRSCAAALARSPKLPMLQPLTRSMVQASLAIGDREQVAKYLPDLMNIVKTTANPWERAQSLLVIAEFEHSEHRTASAITHAKRALRIAKRGGFNEIVWLAGELLTKLDAAPKNVRRDEDQLFERRLKSLHDSSSEVFDQLANLALV